MVAGIIHQTIDEFKIKYESKPENIIVCIGPSISVINYEVGPEVIEKVINITGDTNGIIRNLAKKEKGFLDLWELAKFQLVVHGIKTQNIEISGICTYENFADFYSARKEGFNTGRFCTGIVLN